MINSDEFCKRIENLYDDCGSYIDSIITLSELIGIEPDEAPAFLNSAILGKLELEAQSINFIKNEFKTSKLPEDFL